MRPAAVKIRDEMREHPEYLCNIIRAFAALGVFLIWLKIALGLSEVLLQEPEIEMEVLMMAGILLFLGFCLTYSFRWLVDTIYGGWLSL